MKKVICLVVSVMAVLIYGVAMAVPNNPPSAPVTVVNTDANPVPVTGNFGISGTADVNVTNTVPVTGTVAIDNMKEPASIEASCTVNGVEAACYSDDFDVPDGKRLTIEYFSCQGTDLPEGASLTCGIAKTTSYIDPPSSSSGRVLALSTSPTSTGGYLMSMGQSVKLYAESSGNVRNAISFDCLVNNPSDNYVSIRFFITGFYEDVP